MNACRGANESTMSQVEPKTVTVSTIREEEIEGMCVSRGNW